MTQIDLSKLSIAELETLEVDVQNAIEQRKIETADALRKELEEKAAAAGLTLEEVLGSKRSKRGPRSPAKPKYQNPTNTSQTWTGVGRKPKWIIEAVDAGKSLESLLIS